MVSPNVSRVLEETKRLSIEERRQLAALLSNCEGSWTAIELDELLARSGVVCTAPAMTATADTVQAEAWQPVVIAGEPLSETIIGERR